MLSNSTNLKARAGFQRNNQWVIDFALAVAILFSEKITLGKALQLCDLPDNARHSKSAKPDHILDELAPQENQAAFRILEMTVAG